MDVAAAMIRINPTNILASSATISVIQPVHLHQGCRKSSPIYSRRNSATVFITRCTTKPGLDSNSATNKNTAVQVDGKSTAQHLASSPPDQDLISECSRGLVFDLGPSNDSWDGMEIGSPVVKRFIGDNEERWYMWYHGRNDSKDESDSIGLAVSGNGIHWRRGVQNVRSCGDVGMVMACSKNWWGFDTLSIRPSEMIIMSTSMYSSVYWLYYTGFTSEQVDVPKFGKVFKSLPGLACSQDGRHWARIEGDHHSGAVLDVGTGKEWDSLFIGEPHVVVHSSDDMRMYYHSFDVENGHYAIGIARSRDGIRWVKLGKIMGAGSNGCFDEFGVKNACVRRNKKDGNYLMAYEGVSGDGRKSIGLAVSEDGLTNWKRLQEEPVLRPSDDDGWDNKLVVSPCLVHMEGNVNEWRLYYVGVNHEGTTGIGMAVSRGSNAGAFRRWEKSLILM